MSSSRTETTWMRVLKKRRRKVDHTVVTTTVITTGMGMKKIRGIGIHLNRRSPM